MASTNTSQRNHCIRCGECCRSSTPSLHIQDLPLLDQGILPRNTLYTVRRGEAVWDNVERHIALTDREMIKVKEKGNGAKGCIFYDDEAKACRIYAHRPVQCSALRCWDPSEFLDVHGSPKLERAHLLPPGAATALIAEHENRCSYRRLEKLVMRIRKDGDKPLQEILKMLRFDFHLRPLASERLGVNILEMDLLFGRPLIRTIRRFGLQVVQESDTFLLTPVEPTGEETEHGLRTWD